MNKRIRHPVVLFGLLLIAVVLCLTSLYHSDNARYWAELKYDDTRQYIFDHQIQYSDRVVASYQNSQVQITLTNGDAQKIVHTVLISASARKQNKEIALAYDNLVIFYQGNTVLGQVEESDGLFLINANGEPYSEPSRTLREMIDIPLRKALSDAWVTNSAALKSK